MDDHMASRDYVNSHRKLCEIMSWKLEGLEDANGIEGGAAQHMKELWDAITLDIESMKRVPEDHRLHPSLQAFIHVIYSLASTESAG